MEVLDKLGVDVSDDVICYVMEHSIRAKRKKAIAERGGRHKNSDCKTQWTEDDDCYYFYDLYYMAGLSGITTCNGRGV